MSLGVAATAAGLSVFIPDLDPQVSACNWADRRRKKYPDRPGPDVLDVQPGRLQATLEKVQEAGIDLAIIDTPGHLSESTLAAARCADLVLIPIAPSLIEAETIGNTRSIIRMAGDPPCLVILCGIPPTGDRHEQMRRGFESQGIRVCPHTIGHSVIFGDSIAMGLTPLEYDPKGKRAQEILQVYNYTMSLLDGQNTKESDDAERQAGPRRIG